ncbi:hypothetical protein CRUP_012980 [Coryphaenoides rupestris]|nr:hypothetical protein CRUP_012980 [Coryphaenoides rupestris]
MSILEQKWTSVYGKVQERKAKLTQGLGLAKEFHSTVQDLLTKMAKCEESIGELPSPSYVLVKEVNCFGERKLMVENVGSRLTDLSRKEDCDVIHNLVMTVQDRYKQLVQHAADRGKVLEEVKKNARQFNESWRLLMDWITEVEHTLDTHKEIAVSHEEIKQQLTEQKEFQKLMRSKRPMYEATLKNGRSLHDRAPGCQDRQHLENLLAELKDSWDTINGKSMERQHKLEEALLFSGRFTDALQALNDWLYRAEPQLAEDMPVGGDKDTVGNLIDKHKAFQKELGKRAGCIRTLKRSVRDLTRSSTSDAHWLQEQMDELEGRWEAVCKLSVTKQDRLEGALKQAEKFDELVHTFMERLSEVERGVEQKAAGERRSTSRLQPAPAVVVLPLDHLEPHTAQLSLLVSGWQQLWLLASARQTRLEQHQQILIQMEEFANFDFNVWRKRYMQWISHLKSRILDVFRSIDRDQDGRISLKEFIDNVLASKFPTNPLEMNAVAGIFDTNGDGFIDYYEFFGDSQQLRMVRILRSTLMVRVGGGWTALDEFLVKNDPLKGRTNLKIKEKYLSPVGGSTKGLSVSRSNSSLSLYSSASAPTSPMTRKALLRRSLSGDRCNIRPRSSIAALGSDLQLTTSQGEELTPSPCGQSPSPFGDSQQLRMVRILRSTLMVRVGGGWTALDEFLVKNDPCRGNRSNSSLSLYSSASAPTSPMTRKALLRRSLSGDRCNIRPRSSIAALGSDLQLTTSQGEELTPSPCEEVEKLPT